MILAASSNSVPLNVLLIILSAAFTNNILLTRFLGMCPFLSISRQIKSAAGMGLAVVFVTTITCGLNALVYDHLLKPHADILPTESIKLILFIVVIAAVVQLLEMIIEKISLKLYFALGIFLPLITVNCAILGASLFMVNQDMTGWRAWVYGFGTGLGWCVAMLLMAGIRQRLDKSKANIPAGLEGPGITLIISGILALAFIIFQGMIKL
jgi:Na+-transporting NADH:ubiquinone oxidoreductase subunit E